MKTNRIYRLLIAAFAMIALSSCIRVNVGGEIDHNYVDSEKLGKVVEKDIEVEAFTEIDVCGAVQLILLQSEDSLGYSVKARGNEKSLEKYNIEVLNGKLIAEQKNDNGIFNGRSPLMTLTVTVPSLDKVVLSGACILRQDSVFHQRQTVLLEASGAAEITLNDFEADVLSLNLSGATDVELHKVNCIGLLQIETSGASDIKGNVTSQCLFANVDGAGEIDLNIDCSSDVTVNASGAADVDLSGTCKNLIVNANKYSSDVDVEHLTVTGIKSVPDSK